MKTIALALVISLFAGCATAKPASAGLALKNFQFTFDTAEERPKPVLEPRGATDKHYIPVIPLYGEVTEESVDDAIELLNQAEKAHVDGVIIDIDSPGGSVWDGMRLIRKIESFPAPTTCFASGDAISMAYATLQTCTSRAMLRRGVAMAHSVQAGAMMRGNPEDWEAMAEMLRVVNKALAEHCSAKMLITTEYYLSRTRGGAQWWMNWDDALHFGAVDKVYDTAKQLFTELRS